MDDIRFQWDPRKAAANLRKHGVSFTEAETAFSDEHSLRIISARKADRLERRQYQEQDFS